MGLFSVNFININLDNNFDEDDPHANTLIRLLASHSKLKNAEHLKKS